MKNKSFITTLNKITLYETWHDKKSDLSYLHMFKCIVYYHVKKAYWKLNDKSLKCQFLNYEKVNQYHLWNKKKILIFSHVQWNEIVIEVKRYDKDLLILSFDDQINNHQTRTSVTSQKTKSKSLKLKSELIELNNSSDTDISDASSECFKWVIAELINYKTFNDFWIKDRLIVKSSFKLTFWTWIDIESSCSHFQLNSSRVAHIFNLTRLDSTRNRVNSTRLVKNSNLMSRALKIEI